MRYVISYDIIDPQEGEYGRIIGALEGLGAKRILFSQWVLNNDNENPTAETLRDYFLDFLPQGRRRLLVTPMMGSETSSWYNLMTNLDTL